MSETIKKPVLSFPVAFEKTAEFETEDTRFIRVKCWLMHTNENLNGSSFSKEVIEEALPSLAYIPVVGFIERNNAGEDDFSDHRYVIDRNENGYYRRYQGSAYGVILSSEDNNAHFETKLCEDGVERTFLVADGVIWSMFDKSREIMERDIIKDHSIELDENSVDGYEEDGIFHFTKFSFRAACLLGGGCIPAMTGSTVEVQFSLNEFAKTIQTELNDKYAAFTKLVEEQNNFAAMVNEETNQGGIEKMVNTDFTTIFQLFSDISAMVSEYQTRKDYWGDDVPRYYATDIQENEVIVVDTGDNYNYYSFPFTVEGDKPVIDFTEAKRKKIVYADYEEGASVPEGAFNFGKHISEIEETAFSRIEEANGKVAEAEERVNNAVEAQTLAETNYSDIKAEFEAIKPKYDELVEAEQARIDAELDAQKDAEFAKYETVLAGSTEFEELKANKAEMTVEETEGKLAVLYARKTLAAAQTEFSKPNTNQTMTAGIMDGDDNKEGFAKTKYGYVRKSR